MTADTAEETLRNRQLAGSQENSRVASAASEDGNPVRIEPDLEFIRALSKQGGNSLKKCFQCGTCSATCAISPDPAPFPRKEMAWAVWGMKDRLLQTPDAWLCHQCNDCSTRCPRGARPGDVLGAVRQECVRHYAVPGFLGRWVSQPSCIPLLLGIPTALLALGLALRGPIEAVLGISRPTGEKIVYAYSSLFPHWMLNTFFIFFTCLALAAIIVANARFWQAMCAAVPGGRVATPAKEVMPSVLATLRNIVTHDQFSLCTKARPRLLSHLLVFLGFMALSLVAICVVTITLRINPLVRGDFVYPFGFWNPWKVLANLGGIALVAGCLLMIRDRLIDTEQTSGGSYFDWALIAALLLTAITGFITEALHYVRLEPHRHVAYFIHLVFAFTVLVYLPYSKLAHVVYRGTAMVFAEYSGRNGSPSPCATGDGPPAAREKKHDA